MKLYNTRINFIAVILLVLVSCTEQKSTETVKKESRVSELPYYNEASFTPHWFSIDDDSLNQFHTIRDFGLWDQNGDSFSNKDLKGKIYVADFFFTSCPGICPKMTSNMGVLQDEFLNNKNIFLISHSVTPDKDSVDVLLNYAIDKGVNDTTWRLLTGDRDLIYDLGRNYYYVEEDLGIEKTNEDFLHTENFVLVDKEGHIRGIYNGLNKTAIAQLIADVYTLENESKNTQIDEKVKIKS
jgi:protein SCO1/2